MTGTWDATAKLFLASAVIFVACLMCGGLLSLGDIFCMVMAASAHPCLERVGWPAYAGLRPAVTYTSISSGLP
jgi:hypothetical protein